MHVHASDLVLLLLLLSCVGASRVTGRVHVVGDKGRDEELLIPGAGALRRVVRLASAGHSARAPTFAMMAQGGDESERLDNLEKELARLTKELASLETDGISTEAVKPLQREIAEVKKEGTTRPARLLAEATQAVPDAGQARLPLSPDKPDPRAKIPGARELPPCTVVVVGANGRVGSKVVTELLRKHSKVRVRALVRSTRSLSYSRLSYEVGAEDGKQDLRPALERDDDGAFGQRTVDYDVDVQGSYGLERLEIIVGDVRYPPDVRRAIAGADCVIFCATTFGERRTRLPERLDDFNRNVADFGASVFELRLPFFGRAAEDDKAAARKASTKGKTADEDGVQVVLDELGRELSRRSQLAALAGRPADAATESLRVPMPFVLVSACAALGYDAESLQENEFGFRKRQGEAAVRASGIQSLILRPAILDQLSIEEGLRVESRTGVSAEALEGPDAEGAAGVKQEDLRKNRIHTRDVARVLVGSLFGVEGAATDGPRSHTFEIWTESFGQGMQNLMPGALFAPDTEAVRQKWRAEGREEME